jgi:hypothetical protein
MSSKSRQVAGARQPPESTELPPVPTAIGVPLRTAN